MIFLMVFNYICIVWILLQKLINKVLLPFIIIILVLYLGVKILSLGCFRISIYYLYEVSCIDLTKFTELNGLFTLALL